MPAPKPIFSRPGDNCVIDINRHERNYLVYLDPQGTKHSMCWDDSRWFTACRIMLRLERTDLRDILMSVPTCILCICAEDGVKPP